MTLSRRSMMRTTLAILVLAGATAADATTLSTGMIFFANGTSVFCGATNVSPSEVVVTIRILDGAGQEVEPAGAFGIAPGQSQGALSESVGDFRRCEFRFKGNKRALRALLAISESASDRVIDTITAE